MGQFNLRRPDICGVSRAMVFEWAKSFRRAGLDTLLEREKTDPMPRGEFIDKGKMKNPKNFATVLLTFHELKINFPRCLLPASTA